MYEWCQTWFLCLRVFAPYTYDFLKKVGDVKKLSQIPSVFIAFLSLLHSCFFEPILNIFALYIVGRRNFGRFLASFVVMYLFSLISILYTCLIPRRLIFIDLCSSQQSPEPACDLSTEWLTFSMHLVCSHLLIINLVFHLICVLVLHPGRVPHFLPLGLPSVTVCSRCIMRRPMRSHHCSICQQCILRMDHHCPWLANCIGIHNHRHFYLLLAYMFIGGIYMLTVGYADFLKHMAEIDAKISSNANPQAQALASIHASPLFFDFYHSLCRLCIRLAFIAVPLIFGLCVWQTYIISTNQTSIEYFINQRFSERLKRRGYSTYRNPYDLGWKRNWSIFLGLYDTKIQPTLGTFSLSCRLIRRVLLPHWTKFSPDSGLEYELNIPSLDDLLQSLSDL